MGDVLRSWEQREELKRVGKGQWFWWQALNKDFILFTIMWMCICLWEYVYMSVPEGRNVRSPGAGVMCGCEQSDMGVGHLTQVLCKSSLCS